MSTKSENIYHIKNIQFTVFNNEIVKDFSSVYKDINGINLGESYENSEPKRGGLVDTRLGITDKNLDCAYCGLNDRDCPGHFGHTELSTAIFHAGFFSFVKSILKCICIRSSKLLADRDEVKRLHKRYHSSKKIFEEVKLLCSKVKVSEVGIPVPKIKDEKQRRTGAINIIAETSLSNVADEEKEGEFVRKVLNEVLTPNHIYNIFRNISDEDWNLMGFDSEQYRPEDLIIKTFPIPPVAIRPSIRADFLASSTYEDLLTHKLADIVKTNEKLRKQMEKELLSGETSRYSNDLRNWLQYHITTYFENDKDSFLLSESKVGGRPFKSITQRLKGKQGRIRQNLMGKRVNFSARSVITGDPNLKLDELGIPVKVAMELTFPEIVTPYNIDRLTKLVRNGRYIYPGANFVVQTNSMDNHKREFDLRYRKKTIKLRYGDIVERHLINGDPVLFNRQPSLHKLSMMAHKARIIDDNRYSTFRMNVSATSPYNADFDGDEMNVHAPQSVQTQTELAMIADIKKQIISAKDGKPIIKPVQDAILGSYLLTHDDVKIDWRDVMNILSFSYDVNLEKIKKNRTYTGKQLFSNIIPRNINYIDGKIKIKNGDLLEGNLNKKSIANIVYNCVDSNNFDITKNFIDNVQRLIVNWLLMRGFTVGLGDCIIKSKEVMNKIYDEIEKKKLEINYLITEIENNPELLDADTFEMTIQNNLSSHKGTIEKLVMNSLDNNNNFYIMINSGSKGGGVNARQIMGSLGQDIFLFKRISKDVNNRSLPHFFQNDDRAEARGFIGHSYFEGLNPQEFFFHHMTGREGLIDTAIKTAETGYIARRLMKALEDIGIKYDGLVRTGNNTIIQYNYGDNNLDQTKQRKVKFNSVKMGNDKLSKIYSFTSKEISDLSKKSKMSVKELEKLNNTNFNKIKSLRNQFRIIQKLCNVNYTVICDSYQIPINIKRIIRDNMYSNIIDNTFCSPEYITNKINEILSPLITRYFYLSKKDIKNTNLLKVRDEKISKTLFEYTLHEFLSPKRVIYEYKLSKKKFDNIIKEVVNGFNNSIIDAGEMVGSIAAQHIGEVATQMTLNTFHATGSGSVGMQGVPRCEEIIRVSNNPKTPIMWIYLSKDIRNDKEKASDIASKISFTIFDDVYNSYEIIYDPNTNKDGYTKRDKVGNPFYTSNKKSGKIKYENMSWLLRIKMNRTKMIENNLSLIEIKAKFVKFWNYKINNIKGIKKIEKKIINSIVSCSILSNYDNSDEPMLHIRFELSQLDYNLLIEIKDWFFQNIILKGMSNIDGVNLLEDELLADYDDMNKNVIENNEHMITTDGINMIAIRKIKGIDLNRTYCNNIKTIYKLYGIEAVRNSIIKELNEVNKGKNINFHHISLLVDLMTNTGKIVPIDRHGLNKLNRSPLTKSSFEMPIDQLVKAAVFNEVDPINSVSSQIMVGRVITGGTGLPQIMIDVDSIQNSEFIEDIKLINKGEFIQLEGNHLLMDILTRKIGNIFMP